MSQTQHTNKQQGSRASLIVLIVLAFLLMISAAVLVASIPEGDDLIAVDDPEQTAVLTEKGMICDPVEAQQLFPFNDGIFKVSGSRIAFLDFQGNEQYSVDVDMTLPFVKSNGKIFFAADKEGFSYIVLDDEGEKFRGSLEGRIIGASISQDGDLAVIQDQNDSTGVVSFIDGAAGRKSYDCHFPESGFVLSVEFLPNGEYFDVVLLNTMTSSAEMIFKRFARDGSLVGQLMPELGQIHPILTYNSSGNMIACGRTGIAALSYESETPLWQSTYSEVQTVLQGESSIFIVAAQSIGGSFSLYKLDNNGVADNIYTIGEQVTGASEKNGHAIIFWSSQILVIDTATSEKVFAEDLEAEIIRAEFSDDGTILATTRNGIVRILLP